ncbi:MAG: glycosyltransferase family 2 protein [Phycisphaerales bacterium]|nr:glycosyltransferase family 2 protein [Phycisphaerales bacterium]
MSSTTESSQSGRSQRAATFEGRPEIHRVRRRLAVVIPALNEEAAIGSTLERALAARTEIVSQTPIDEVLIVFVNDGSTDGTQAVADRYGEVIKIRFERNRGYGAAIKAGFQATDAELVGFMDADGTCDPRSFISLLNRHYETNADIVIGSRMNPESEMPFLRKLGNRIFARLVGMVSGQRLSDVASGMRVIRRESLKKMMPLPDGLHFTPAMSCIAVLDPGLSIEEVAMPYKERLGRSKLSVFKDGLRFLAIILFASACFNPVVSLSILGVLFALFGAAVTAVVAVCGGSEMVMAVLGGAFLFVLLQALFAGALCHQLNFLLFGPPPLPGRLNRFMDRFVWTKPMVKAGIGLLATGLILCGVACMVPGPRQAPLWLIAALCIALAGWIALGGVILRMIWAAREKQRAALVDPFAPVTLEHTK